MIDINLGNARFLPLVFFFILALGPGLALHYAGFLLLASCYLLRPWKNQKRNSSEHCVLHRRGGKNLSLIATAGFDPASSGL